MTEQPFVSVVVPVYNDARCLRTCLQALEEQTYPAERYEVIVVDNGSSEPLQPLVARFRQARLVTEQRPGAYAARNRGIAVAGGQVIAFTDADCIPTPTWLAHGVRSLTDTGNRGLVAGRIETLVRDPRRPTAIELLISLTSYDQNRNVTDDHFAATANLFTTRTCLQSVGWFDASLKSRGDVVWGKRVHLAGYEQAYADDAVVFHRAPSFGRFCTKMIRFSGGIHDLDRSAHRRDLGLTKRHPLLNSHQFFSAFDAIATDRRLRRGDRPKVLGLLLLARALMLMERMRLSLGGTSTR